MTFTFAHRLRNDTPVLMTLAIAIALAALPMMAASLLDTRQIAGDGIWAKPLKFHIGLVIYLATLAFFARYLPAHLHTSRLWNLYLGYVAATIIAELVWIGAASALGTTSHFNQSSPLWAILYPIMGVCAVSLTSLSLAMGVAIWRNPATGLTPALHLGVALGLILTFVLTVVVAGTMSSGTGHLVGTPVTGATLPIMGWSREVGDLRAAHFLATHTLHAIPLAGLAASRLLPDRPARGMVLLVAAIYGAIVLGTFAQALAGLPLI